MRTERQGRSLGIGTTGPADDTLDRWTDIQCYITRDAKVHFTFQRINNQGKLIDQYECIFDDETALIDLAIQALNGVVGIQYTEDMLTRFDEMREVEVDALDGPDEIAEKQTKKDALLNNHRRVVRRVKNKPRQSRTTS